MRSLTLPQARRLALHAQGLAAPPPRRRPGTAEIEAVVERIGCLQLDPVSAVARSPLLVLHARLGSFDDALLDRAAYEEKRLFDYWAHEASLVPVSDLPLHRLRMRTYLEESNPRRELVRAFYEANREFADAVVDELRARGPLQAKDLEDRSAEPWRHGYWTDEVSERQTIARMLQVLWLTGRIGVAGRAGAARRWDVMERCLPPDPPPAEELSAAEVTRRAALRAVGMLGVARGPHVRAHFLRSHYDGLPAALEALAGAGELERVRVGDLAGTWYARPADLDVVEGLRPGTRTVALSPFDNVLCDRARTAELFDFDHRLEIYTPAAKRRWGYYVLPILHRERFVARADLAIDRDAGILRALSFHREPGVRWTPALDRNVSGALERLASWRGASTVAVAPAP
jgi:uncharacterized protein YcaQ